MNKGDPVELGGIHQQDRFCCMAEHALFQLNFFFVGVVGSAVHVDGFAAEKRKLCIEVFEDLLGYHSSKGAGIGIYDSPCGDQPYFTVSQILDGLDGVGKNSKSFVSGQHLERFGHGGAAVSADRGIPRNHRRNQRGDCTLLLRICLLPPTEIHVLIGDVLIQDGAAIRSGNETFGLELVKIAADRFLRYIKLSAQFRNNYSRLRFYDSSYCLKPLLYCHTLPPGDRMNYLRFLL